VGEKEEKEEFTVFLGDGLGSEMLLYGDGVVCSPFHSVEAAS